MPGMVCARHGVGMCGSVQGSRVQPTRGGWLLQTICSSKLHSLTPERLERKGRGGEQRVALGGAGRGNATRTWLVTEVTGCPVWSMVWSRGWSLLVLNRRDQQGQCCCAAVRADHWVCRRCEALLAHNLSYSF